MAIINNILDINILLGFISLGLNLFVLGVMLGRGRDDDEQYNRSCGTVCGNEFVDGGADGGADE